MSCIGLALAIYAGLALIGAPIWLLVRPESLPLSDALACPLVGLSVLDVFAWYWLRYTNSGMVAGLPILAACVTVALVAIVWSRRSSFHAPSLAASASTVGMLIAVSVVVVVEFRVPLKVGHLTAASIWDFDIAGYVTVAGSLVSHGFAAAGNIAGVNLGAMAAGVSGGGRPGTFSVLAAAAAGTGLGTWQVAIPVLLVGVALGTLAVRDTARLLLPGSLVAASVIALLATMASLFGYITTNYFLAQVLVMPLVLAELLVLHWIARRSTWRERVGGLVLLASIVVTAVLSYSPMPFLMQPIIVAAVCLGELGLGWLRRSAVVAVSTVGTFIVTCALVPEPVRRSIEFVRVSGGTGIGWPLGLMTPLDVLGFHQVIRTPRPIVGLFVVESLIVGSVVLVAVWTLWNEQRRAAICNAAAAFAVLGSYAVVYASRGYSYDQWKWISFFQPVFIAAVFALVVAAAGVLVRRWGPGRTPSRLAAAILGAALVAGSARILVTGTRNNHVVWVAGGPTLPWSTVGTPLSQLAERPAIDHLNAVNVKLSQWDTLWAAYFLEPTTRVYLGYSGYFPASATAGLPTLKPVLDPAAPMSVPRSTFTPGVGWVAVRYVLVKP